MAEDSSRATQWISDNVYHPWPCSIQPQCGHWEPFPHSGYYPCLSLARSWSSMGMISLLELSLAFLGAATRAAKNR